jgi:CRISPR/Cas system-associated endonuclease/helicase Cas3
VESLSIKGGDTMTIIISVEKAKEEILRLQQYIELVETYEANTLDKLIIKEYALTNSIDKTVKAVNAAGYTINQKVVERDYVVSLLKKRGKDELHKLVRSAYMEKTKYKRAVERRLRQRNSTF